MKKVLSLLLVLCFALFSCTAMAEEAAADIPGELTVTGEAQVVVPADYAELTLGVSTLAEAVSEASATNSATLDAVIEALHGIGIAPEDMVTENFSISPVYDYQYGKLGESQTVTGYQVENRVRVTVRDVTQVGAVLDTGVAAGANEAFGITFCSTQAADAANQALQAAVAEGQRKAELLAEACGQTLGALISVTESPYGGSGGVTLKYDAAVGGTTILANDLTVSAQVSLTYQLAE